MGYKTPCPYFVIIKHLGEHCWRRFIFVFEKRGKNTILTFSSSKLRFNEKEKYKIAPVVWITIYYLIFVLFKSLSLNKTIIQNSSTKFLFFNSLLSLISVPTVKWLFSFLHSLFPMPYLVKALFQLVAVYEACCSTNTLLRWFQLVGSLRHQRQDCFTRNP